MSIEARVRQIKIKAGVVKRIMKEKSSYEKEVVQTENRIQKMKDEGRDEYDIRKMNEVLAESQMMVPECLKRLANALEDLKNVLDAENDLSEQEEFNEALKYAKEAEALLRESR